MDTAKVLVRRVALPPVEEVDDKGKPTGKQIEPKITGFSYLDPKQPESYSHFVADEATDQFEMTPAQAAAAVATGGFAVSGDSKSQIEEDQHDTQPLISNE